MSNEFMCQERGFGARLVIAAESVTTVAHRIDCALILICLLLLRVIRRLTIYSDIEAEDTYRLVLGGTVHAGLSRAGG